MEDLNTQLDAIGEESSTLNPIVQSILSNAAATMGLGDGGRWGQESGGKD